MNKRVRVPPETEMKKQKIKKIVAWEHNESIRKKKDVEKCAWDWENKYANWKKKWEHNEMIIKKNDVEKMTETETKKICEMEKKMRA